MADLPATFTLRMAAEWFAFGELRPHLDNFLDAQTFQYRWNAPGLLEHCGPVDVQHLNYAKAGWSQATPELLARRGSIDARHLLEALAARAGLLEGGPYCLWLPPGTPGRPVPHSPEGPAVLRAVLRHLRAIYHRNISFVRAALMLRADLNNLEELEECEIAIRAALPRVREAIVAGVLPPWGQLTFGGPYEQFPGEWLFDIMLELSLVTGHIEAIPGVMRDVRAYNVQFKRNDVLKARARLFPDAPGGRELEQQQQQEAPPPPPLESAHQEQLATFIKERPDRGQRALWKEWNEPGSGRPRVPLKAFPQKDRGRPRKNPQESTS